jgi:Icc-related predicted phosphoesterase
VPEGEGRVRRCGCPHLLQRIKDVSPQLVVYGHIHEGRGEWELDQTRLANVTLLDERYNIRYRPWVLDLDGV